MALACSCSSIAHNFHITSLILIEKSVVKWFVMKNILSIDLVLCQGKQEHFRLLHEHTTKNTLKWAPIAISNLIRNLQDVNHKIKANPQNYLNGFIAS